MMMPDSETTALSQKLSSLYEQRRAALQELAALRERQERVPLAGIPGFGSAVRVLKRSYLLPQMQTCQQTIDQLSLEAAETLNMLMRVSTANVSAALAEQSRQIEHGDNVLKRHDERLARLEQSQVGLATHIGQISVALTQLQESGAGLGAHLNLLNDAVSNLQQQQVALSTNVNQINEALASVQHSQSGLDKHVRQIDKALTELQGTYSQLGVHIVQIDSALGSLQQDHSQLTTIISRLQALPDQVAVQDEAVQRLAAQLSYLPGSINELIADLRHQIEQIAPNRAEALIQTPSTMGADENRRSD